MKIIGRSRKDAVQPLILPIVLGMLFPALFLAVLRIEILDLRHQLATNLQQERVLLEEQDQLVVNLGQRRDFKMLQRVAGERGFGHPERVINLRNLGSVRANEMP
jgi:hypothetical protein